MTEKTIVTGLNLEARPAAILVQLASQYNSSVFLKRDNKTVNAKSIMGILALGLTKGQFVTLRADGADEVRAVSEIEGLLLR